jgi:small multidrug resistance family-3 protein
MLEDFSITRILSVFGLFLITAIAEILGCYFPYLILKEGKVHGYGFLP